jgi:uncharacterized membrane protein
VISGRDAAGFRLLLSRLLLAGVSLAAGLMIIGLLSALAVGWTGSLVGAGPVSHEVGDFSQALPGVLELRPFAIAQLGLLVLLATPVLRVATSVVAFALEGDRLYALISGVVLAVLLTSIFLVR